MGIADKLASSLNRRDEEPNIELAKQVAAKNDSKAIQELMTLLTGKNKDLQNDGIKVLYEVGERKPALIAGYIKEFVELLDSKNNRLQWGAMTALGLITTEDPKDIYKVLPKIMAAAGKGSVIMRDHAVNILIKLMGIKQYADDAFVLLLEQLKQCPTNQLPMYAENAAPVISAKNKAAFVKALSARLDDIDKDSKRKRVEKVIKKLSAS